jgi:outer membrane protein
MRHPVSSALGIGLLGSLLAPWLAAQTPGKPLLTLSAARTAALQNHPRIKSAAATARAAEAIITETRSAQLPLLSGNFTSAEAQHSTVLSAGTLQTSSLFSRVASGLAITQLITDFGRTSSLIGAASLRAAAQSSNTEAVREMALLQVEQSFYQALAARAVEQATQAAVRNREVLLRQVRALAESSMRSTLDVRFAEVALSQAQLDLYRAENNSQEADANLSAAMGLDHTEQFDLEDEPPPQPMAGDPVQLVNQAWSRRPDLKALNLQHDAARRFADAEGKLNRPSVSFIGAAGLVPAGDPRLAPRYSAAGLNVSIPLFNGSLFTSRQAEASERATAAQYDAQDAANQIARQVRIAWLEASTAARKIDVSERLVLEAGEALRLARTRYENGLGSIVELSQAQLNQTAAEIENANSRYEYLSRRVMLRYAMGDL